MNKKKVIIALLLALLMPIPTYAYSMEVIPGGENVGIEIKTEGILIIGFYKINGSYNKGDLKVGDIIIKVNDKEITDINSLVSVIDAEARNNQVKLTYKRNKDIKNSTLTLIESEGLYKTGLYVKDSLTGIGTITYIDPQTMIYGALGHEIIESNTNKKIEVKTGSIFRSKITSIDKSAYGTPGGKKAQFYYNTKYGSVQKNTSYGIYGIYEENLPQKELVSVAKSSEVDLGKAQIYTVLKDEIVTAYEINITKIDTKNEIKNIYFEITDENLLVQTGGVVQGMSGSPIIQNNKIIGAVTHVIVENPETGYGIFIETMLQEGEK